MIICCYLLFKGIFKKAKNALEYYEYVRTLNKKVYLNKQGVTIAS